MASVKAKFRPSVIEGKEGTIYYQIIQNRVIRQLKTIPFFNFVVPTQLEGVYRLLSDYPEPCNPSVKDGLPDICR